MIHLTMILSGFKTIIVDQTFKNIYEVQYRSVENNCVVSCYYYSFITILVY